MDKEREYHGEFKMFKRLGYWRYFYEIRASDFGCHLHISDFGEDRGPDRWSAGIEFHYQTPLSDRPPDHDDCPILKGPCWHDGSSLWAEEFFLPIFKSCRSLKDHQDLLEIVAEKAFTRMRGEKRHESD